MNKNKPENLKQLIEKGIVKVAKLPEKNDYLFNQKGELDLEKLDLLNGYTLPLVSHDYSAKTPLMWNSAYERLNLEIRNIMLVADPENADEIFFALRKDEKYLGGGLGVGWKEKGIKYLDNLNPTDLKAVNIVVKNSNGTLMGYNTDAQGFVKSLEDKFIDIGKGGLENKNIILLGAGGVSKEVARLLAKKGIRRLTIINRTTPKAVEIAYYLNKSNSDNLQFEAIGVGEEIIRGYALNSFLVPDAIINTTDKGSDGRLEKYSAFAAANLESTDGVGVNNTLSRTIGRELNNLNPNIIIADIVLPKSGLSITLRHAKNEGLENLLTGIPMVINQAAPAYVLIQEQYPQLHKTNVAEDEVLKIFREVAQ